jgi:signal transduction histidine kinase
MNGHYAYTPEIWPSVFTVLLLIALAAYSWRRGSVPGAVPFAISCLLAMPMALSLLMGYLAVNAETRLFWGRFDDIWWLPSTTAITCFILEYAWPGHWLTRRNLFLLSIVPVLSIPLILIDDFYQEIPVNPVLLGMEGISFGAGGGIPFLYSFILFLINMVVFTWLFIRSPQYRIPVILMVIGQITVRLLLLGKSPELEARLLHLPVFVFPYLAYTIALFGFHMFDPIPIARQMTVEQLHVGMLVLDPQERVTSMNPSAERFLDVSMKRARGRPVRELLPAYPQGQEAIPDETEIEFSLGTDPALHYYILMISMLKDFRGLEVGRLLLLRDVTEQKRAQSQIMEQQRVLATFKEREQLARELHDSIGQVMGYAGFQLEAASKLIRDGDDDAAILQLNRLAGVFRDTHADVREYILNLRSGLSPHQPFFETLQEYLQGFTSNYDIRTRLDVDKIIDASSIPSESQMQFFRIVQEALSNARKHGKAHVVQVSFAGDDHTVHMTIQDDGIGFDPAVNSVPGKSHFGLQFMRERAEALGGCLQIESSPGVGTRVILDVPRGNYEHARASGG